MTSLTKQLLEASDTLDLLSHLLSPEDGAEVSLILTMLRNKRIDLIESTNMNRLFWFEMRLTEEFDNRHINVIRSIADRFDYIFKISVGYFFLRKRYLNGAVRRERIDVRRNGADLMLCFAIKHRFVFPPGSFDNDGYLIADEEFLKSHH